MGSMRFYEHVQNLLGGVKRAKVPNFVVTPRHPPNLEYIMAIDAACTTPGQQVAEELRAEINSILRPFQPPNHNQSSITSYKGT